MNHYSTIALNHQSSLTALEGSGAIAATTRTVDRSGGILKANTMFANTGGSFLSVPVEVQEPNIQPARHD